jgi:vacuolar-type H+-ATPase subunit E/Vma4
MKPTEENVKLLSNAVLADARGDAAQVLADAKSKAGEIHRRGREQAAAVRAKILERAAAEAERVRSRSIATAQLKARTMQLAQREKLLLEVFEAAREQLSSAQQSPDYEKTAIVLLREALVKLGDGTAKIRADKVTRKLTTAGMLKKISKELNVQVQLAEPLRGGTGVLVETEDGHRQYDNTLETRLKRMQDSLRSPVYHILMGEAL